MKKLLLLAVVLVIVVAAGNSIAVADTTSLAGKIIALDAGHGEVAADGSIVPGASNAKYGVIEADVNRDVVQVLEAELGTYGAHVVVTTRFSTRRDRVNDAAAKCAAVDVTGDGIADNRKCDILVSVHHNGSTEPTHDGTLTIYTQGSDKPLAKALYDSLLPLTNKPEGLLNGGYGMTVYKNLVSTITEAYYITNDAEAEQYVINHDVQIGREVDAQVLGIANYFTPLAAGGGKKGR